MEPTSPLRNDGVTIACERCGRAFAPSGRRRFCSAACRQALWRRRHPTQVAQITERATRATTVYECPSCETRFLGAQRCPGCGIFCRRIGPGGPCPHCDEPVALADLLPNL